MWLGSCSDLSPQVPGDHGLHLLQLEVVKLILLLLSGVPLPMLVSPPLWWILGDGLIAVMLYVVFTALL
jgi:hypothetical protein